MFNNKVKKPVNLKIFKNYKIYCYLIGKSFLLKIKEGNKNIEK
jgi:hypothetical protein